MPHPVTPEDLAAVPAEHRRTIARWLAEKAAAVRPSLFLTPECAAVVQDFLTGAAVDLVDPLAEDSTTQHADSVLRSLEDGTVPVPPGLRVERTGERTHRVMWTDPGECGAYYGVGDGTTAVCRRSKNHPPVSADGVGHSPEPDRG